MDLSSELVPSPATKAYTDFLNTVAANEVGPGDPHNRHGARVLCCVPDSCAHWDWR